MVDPVRQDVVARAGLSSSRSARTCWRTPRAAWTVDGSSRWRTSSSGSAPAGGKWRWSRRAPLGRESASSDWANVPPTCPSSRRAPPSARSALMQLYQESLSPHGIHTAQILLTAGDFDSRARYLNTRNTIRTLFEYNALPIINENDTVSVAEIKFGDNDHLAAMVTNLLRAPLARTAHQRRWSLLRRSAIQSECRAALDRSPHRSLDHRTRRDHHQHARHRRHAQQACGQRDWRRRRASRSSWRTAASTASSTASSRAKPSARSSCRTGKMFPAWKRWLGFTARPRGMLHIDAGAKRAVVEQGKSLLPVGVTGVTGEFGKGEVVSISRCGW